MSNPSHAEVYWAKGDIVILCVSKGAREMTVRMSAPDAMALAREMTLAARTTMGKGDAFEPAQSSLPVGAQDEPERPPSEESHRNALRARLDAYLGEEQAHAWPELEREFGPDVRELAESLRTAPYNRRVVLSDDGALVGLVAS